MWMHVSNHEETRAAHARTNRARRRTSRTSSASHILARLPSAPDAFDERTRLRIIAKKPDQPKEPVPQPARDPVSAWRRIAIAHFSALAT
jgi:hypothetical protein